MSKILQEFDLTRLKELHRAEKWNEIISAAQELMRDNSLPIPAAAEWAFALAKLGKAEEANRIAMQVLQAAPACLLAMRARIVVLLQAKELPQALALAQSLFQPPFVLDDAEESANCILLLAVVHNSLKEHDKALTLATEAQKIHSTAKGFGFLGLIVLQQGKFEQAAQLLTQSVQIHSDPQVWSLLAEAYHQQNRIEDMVQTYETALRLHPDHELFLTNLGELYSRLNRHEEAETLLRRAVTLNPQSSAGWVNLSKLYYKMECTDKYLESLQTAIQLCPDSPEILNNLALVHSIQGREAESLSCLQQAHALAPQKDPIALSLAQAYEKNKQSALADSILAQVVARNPHDPAVLATQANIAMMRNEFDECIDFVKQALANELWFLKQQSSLSLFGDGSHPPMDVYDASETLIAVCKFLERLNVTYFLASGTLLGIVRGGELLAHDKDADLGITWDVDREWLLQQIEATDTLKINGVIHPKPDVAQWNIQVVCKGTSIGVDFFFYKPDGEDWLTGFHAEPTPWLQRFKQRPLTTIEYKGHQLSIPENPEGYLEEVYGPNWRTPMPSYDTLIAAENLCPETYTTAKLIGYNRLYEALMKRSWKKVLWYCEALKRFDNPPILDELANWLRGAMPPAPPKN